MKTKTLLLSFLLIFLGKALLLGVIPLTDPSEGRYASIALTMAKSGNYLMPQIWKAGKLVPFMGKPALGFWLMAASINLFGANEFAVRLPGFLAGLCLLGIMFFVLRRHHSNEIAWMSVLITGSTTSFYLLSGAVLVDAVLALFAIGAVFWYYGFLREKQRGGKKVYSLLVFTFLGFGFMTKGPVALVYFGLPVFLWTLFNRQWRTLREHAWIAGIPLFLAIGIPWFILAERAHPGFLDYFFIHENFMRFCAKNYGDLYEDGRKLPYGTALLLSAACFLPWLAVAARLGWKQRRGLWEPIRKWPAGISAWLANGVRDRGDGRALFFAGMVSVTLFWCLARQLVIYYLIPLVPLFAVWCAQVLRSRGIPLRKVAVWGTALAAFYAFITLPLSLYLSTARSTEEVVEQIRTENIGGAGKTARIVFVRRMPYSAYFYAHDWLLPHAKESAGKSIRRGLALHNACVFITPKRYLRQIPAELFSQVRVAAHVGHWLVLVRKKTPKDRSVAACERSPRNRKVPWFL